MWIGFAFTRKQVYLYTFESTFTFESTMIQIFLSPLSNVDPKSVREEGQKLNTFLFYLEVMTRISI